MPSDSSCAGFSGRCPSVKEEANLRDLRLADEEEARRKKERTRLTWRDYIALSIAALETALFPLVVLVVILFVLAVFFAGHL
jgi:hypothetical protein